MVTDLMFAIFMRFVDLLLHACSSCYCHRRDPPISDPILSLSSTTTTTELPPLDHASPSTPIVAQPGVATAAQSSHLSIITSPGHLTPSAGNPASISPICSRVRHPENVHLTVQALDELIVYLERRIDRLQSTSTAQQDSCQERRIDRLQFTSTLQRDSCQVWEDNQTDIPGFLEHLREREEVAAAKMGGDTIMPLLVEVLAGMGSLHWAAFGCSMLAWGIDKLDKQHQNLKDCVVMLKDTVVLLKQTRGLWAHDKLHPTVGAGKDLMNSNLAEIVEAAVTASAICASCSRDNQASVITRYIGAPTVEKSIRRVNDRIRNLGWQNLAIGQQQILQHSKGSMVMKRALSAYHTVESEDHLLGKGEQINEVERILKMEYRQEMVVAVCLHGMGGVGKSTLALTIYNKLLLQPQKFVSCRVEMGLESEENDLPRFQTEIYNTISSQKHDDDDDDDDQMMSNALPDGNVISNALHGREMLQREFKKSTGTTPILLYIDNVEHPEFLLELLPRLTHLPTGFRLLITSRNKKSSAYLHQLGVSEDCCHSIEVKTLDENDSRTLLRKEALIKVENKDVLDNNRTLAALENQVLRLCDGLPSALKLMGSFIAYSPSRGAESAETWRHVVNAMKEARPIEGNLKDRLYARLRVSIDALDKSLRTTFFDLVTCKLYDLLDMVALGVIFGAEGIQNLIDRHLLDVVSSGYSLQVDCHDVIASLVKRMVTEDHQHHQMRVIHGLAQQFPVVVGEEDLENVGSVSWAKVSDAQLCRMKRLRYASWITVSVHAGSAMEGIDLPDLKVLQIQGVTGIDLPDLKGVNSHGKLKLRSCPHLRLLCVSDGDYVVLEDLMAPNLRELEYRGNLHNLPRCIQHFSVLQSLNLAQSAGSSLPDGISELTSLSCLRLSECNSLEAVPEGISKLTALTELHLGGCESLQCVPEGIGELMSLSTLDLSYCKSLQILPDGMSNVRALIELDLQDCESLRCVPQGIGELTSLSRLDLKRCKSLESLPDGISMLTELTTLYLEDCASLRFIPEGIGELTSLFHIGLSGCRSLQSLPQGISMLTTLPSLNLHACESLQCIPDGISKLTALSELDLNGCKSLQSLPQGISTLATLTKLNLRDCELLPCVPEGITQLRSLSELDLSGCKSLESLPEGMSKLSVLWHLSIEGCESLRCVPQGISQLTDLYHLV